MSTTEKTAEELLQESEQLRLQAIKLQQEAKKQAAEANIRAKQQYVKTACDLLVTKLAAVNIGAQVIKGSVSWQPEKFMVVLDSKLVRIDIDINIDRYTNIVVGVHLTLGTYGERPQTWHASKPENLEFDKIIKSLQRRIEKAEAKQIEDQKHRDQYAENLRIRKLNQEMTERLRSQYPGGFVSLSESDRAEGKVEIRFISRIELTEDQAVKLLELVRSFE